MTFCDICRRGVEKSHSKGEHFGLVSEDQFEGLSFLEVRVVKIFRIFRIFLTYPTGKETKEGGGVEAEEEEERRHVEGGVHPVLQLLHKETLAEAIP